MIAHRFVSLLAVFLSFILSSGQAHGAKKDKPCWLELVSSNPKEVLAEKSRSQASPASNAQFLYFVRDLQTLGFRFPQLSVESVVETFEKQSHKNLKAYLKNYDLWLASRNLTPVPLDQKERRFVYWKDHFSPQEGRKHVTLKTDRDLKRDPDQWRAVSVWSVAAGGFNGDGFNFEEMKELPQEYVDSTQGNGIARVALVNQPKWSYVLPLPGTPSGATSYTGMDTRFFGFLSVFAPEALETFAERIKPLIPAMKDPAEILSPGVIHGLAELTENPRAVFFLQSLLLELRFLVLTQEDAATLLAYVATQREALNPQDPRFTGGSYGALSSLTAIVSGQVGPEDYLLKERSYVPPFVGIGGVSGWNMRPGARAHPHWDSLFIPIGSPEIH